jgi:hypothetical protein
MDEIRKMADAKQTARDEARKEAAANYPAFIKMDDVKKGEEFLFKLVSRRDNTITQDAAEKAKKPFLYDVIDPLGETKTLPTHPSITSGMEDEDDEIMEGDFFYMRFDGKELVKNQKAKPGAKFNKWTIGKLPKEVGEELFKKSVAGKKKAKVEVGED